MAAHKGARRRCAREQGPRHPGGGAALGGERALDCRDRGGQGPQARLAFEPQRQGERQGRRDEGHFFRAQERTTEGKRSRAGVPPFSTREGSASGKTTAGNKKSKTGKKSRATRKGKSKDEPLPDFVPPSLATLRAEAPGGDGWVHEIKFDGYRIQAHLEHGDVRLLTRKGLDWTEKFPNVAAAVKKLHATSALIDGEIIVDDARGVSSFSGLQAALKAGEHDSFIYYVFDLLHRDGRSLAELPLIERKAELAELVGHKQTGVIRYSEHFDEAGKTVLRHACEMGLEGIVSKRADAPYRSGRIDTFIKTKCANEQEFVVGGYSHSTAMPNAVGALVVGYYAG